MNKIALALILLILPFSLAYTSPRKKVGIVLSGGGAKGVAHIGVIKALEELNIPIDYIAGTSIGAIIGGLYSIGYTSEQLETIVKQTDWINLLTDKVSREKIPFPFKSNDSKYLVSFPFNNSEKNGGIIKGKNISQLLHQLTEGYQNVTNFDSLPIPFACIATDMARNQKEVIRFGKLSEAMRASMAVPIVFSPIYSGQKVLIDGGFKDNLPIDVVKAMGADIIIGIDVQSELSDADNLHSIAGIANQLMLMICQSSLDGNTKNIDAYVKVDVENYNAASFTKAAIDTLIIRGENAAKANYNTLLSIKNRIGIVNNKRNNKAQLPLFYPQYVPSNDNQLRIGLRFDSEDIAAVMLNINLNKHKFGKAEIAVRGGKQSFLRTQYHFPISKPQWITLSNQIGYNDVLEYIYKTSKGLFWDDFTDLDEFKRLLRSHIKVALFREVFYSKALTTKGKDFAKVFKRKYPSVYKLVKESKREDRTFLANQMMKIESSLFRNILAKLYAKQFKVLTIHDAIVVLDVKANAQCTPELVKSIIEKEYQLIDLLPDVSTDYYTVDNVTNTLQQEEQDTKQINELIESFRVIANDETHPRCQSSKEIIEELEKGTAEIYINHKTNQFVWYPLF